jgi:hypothetical protein
MQRLIDSVAILLGIGSDMTVSNGSENIGRATQRPANAAAMVLIAINQTGISTNGMVGHASALPANGSWPEPPNIKGN